MSQTTTPTSDRILWAVRRLGDSPAGVAASLKSLGVRGLRDCPTFCPVARWLLREVPDAKNVRVMGKPRRVFFRGEGGFEGEARLSYAARDFTWEFDEGKYPELELEPR